jgi:hypothetical protein
MTLKTILLATALALCLSACKSPTALTAKATGCRVTELDIIDSQYKRTGSTTAWCARCKGTNYTCVTNTARDHVECREAAAGSPCG